jgi:hypothetical protein
MVIERKVFRVSEYYNLNFKFSKLSWGFQKWTVGISVNSKESRDPEAEGSGIVWKFHRKHSVKYSIMESIKISRIPQRFANIPRHYSTR